MAERLLVASSNAKKLREMTELLADLPFEVIDLKSLGIRVTVEEYGETFEENARIKAETCAAVGGMLAISDDSGLEVDALAGAPGVLSARYGGDGLDDTGRLELLLENMKDIPADRRAARFVLSIAIARPGRETATFEGRCEGRILNSPTGTNGFGYDPIFQPEGDSRSMAELSADEKHGISHRGRALAAAKNWLQIYLDEQVLRHAG